MQTLNTSATVIRFNICIEFAYFGVLKVWQFIEYNVKIFLFI